MSAVTRADMMTTLMLPPALVRFSAPEMVQGRLCVAGRGDGIWASLFGPGEALSALGISVALDGQFGRPSQNFALLLPVLAACCPNDGELLGWYMEQVRALLTPRTTLGQAVYPAHPVQLLCDRVNGRLNLNIQL